MDDRKQHRTVAHERAFQFAQRDAYKSFPCWCHDLERRMMTDWVLETRLDELSWLDVRDAAVQGWEERHEELTAFATRDPSLDELQAIARRREITAQLAHSFGACEAYRRFAAWCDQLEQKMQRDWQAIFGESDVPSWFEVREAVKAGWFDEHARIAPGDPLRTASNFR